MGGGGVVILLIEEIPLPNKHMGQSAGMAVSCVQYAVYTLLVGLIYDLFSAIYSTCVCI